ncbi:MAG: glutamine--tRNA ligase/YqeY domain fusion protein [SAR202 cluster bacterium]|nr:glutamine--tRNA ligase/YqeY domain fusion protein [SAR202 cluster bacterium]
MTSTERKPTTDFVRQAIADDVAQGKHGGHVHTRFPPEPNGYLHVGHATAIALDFMAAEEFGGKCNLRFDDTNPTKEEVEFVESQMEDIRWLGFDWGDRLFFASDYFDQLYEYAKQLIREGKAYVEGLSAEEVREYRGTLTEPGRASPYRDRPIEENLMLFEAMKEGEFDDGAFVLRAKIDMESPNINMRDPTMYRIRKVDHYRTGDKWCIYPMYDYAHPVSDAIEGITHSLCSLEYEDHRPLYDWFLGELDLFRSRQIEFARFNLSHTVISKRWLLQLVEGGGVSGWDDPRMPTLRALRRRGYTPEAIREFCAKVGIGKTNTTTDMALLEHCIREDLNKRAFRRMAVLHPLKVVIENMPEGEIDYLDAGNNPEDPGAGTRKVAFSRTLYIERNDFMEDPPRKFYRLTVGREVRLRYGYFIKCHEVIKDESGEIVELRCTYDPETRGGSAPDGRKVRATLHWVSADTALDAEVRLYEHLFTEVNPRDVPEGADWQDSLNPDSLTTLVGCKVEPALKDASIGEGIQFERQGYFCVDTDSTEDKLVFNRTVPLRDTWARIQRQSKR